MHHLDPKMLGTRGVRVWACLLTLIVGIGLPTPAFAAAGSPGPGQTAPVAGPGHGNTDESQPRNIIDVRNQVDHRLLVRGNVQINELHGATDAAVNAAFAYSSCVQCQSFAIALQINLYPSNATSVVPQNAAVALNDRCTGCTTVARAIQYNYPEADPTHVPRRIDQLVRQMNQTLPHIHGTPDTTVAQAEAQVDAVISQFQDLAGYLNDQHQQATATDSPDAPAPPPMVAADLPGTATK